MRFSYQLLPEQPLDELLDTLELLDQLGFWACYSANESYHKDMWSLFAASADRTSRPPSPAPCGDGGFVGRG